MQSKCRGLVALLATALFLIPAHSNAQIVARPGILGVVVYESTDVITPWNFLLNPFMDMRLFVRQNEPFSLDQTDIATDAGEYYDVFLSNARGKLDVNGDFIGIHYATTRIRSGFAVGGNIDAVGIIYEDGSIQWASFVQKVITGKGIGNISALAANGMAYNALGPPDGNVTYIGDFEGLLVLGFDN